MAKNNEAKIRFLADTQEFRDNITKANSSLTELRSELKLNAEQMKTNGASVESLTERQRLLQSQLDQARTKTQNLAAQLESCTRNYGENSVEAQKLTTQINNARVAEEQIQQEINRVNQQLSNQVAESNKVESALAQLERTISEQESALAGLKSEYASVALEFGTNSTEARELATRISSLSGELNENRNKIALVETAANNLEGEMQQTGDAARDAEDGFTVLKGTIANLASNAISNAISTISNLATSFWNLGDETRELRTNLGKVEVAFETAGFSAETATETYNDFYAVIGDEGQTTEAVNHLAKMVDTEQELNEWTTICTGVYATFGDSLPIENLTEAANETAKTGQLTGGLADALNWAGVNEEAFQAKLEACNSEAEREALIRETLTGLYSEAAAGYQETNGQIMEANKAQAEYNTALAGLGEIIEPIKTTFMQGMASMLESATAFISGLDMEAVKASIQGAFDYLNNTVFPAIKTGIQWFIDNKDTVIAALAGIVAGIAAFKVVSIVQTAVTAFKAFQTATTGLTIAQKALNLVMSANPIGLVIAAVAGLVAAFVALWNNCEGFRNFWIGLWDGIKNVASAAWEAIKGFFSGAWDAIKNTWSNTKTFFSNCWEGIKGAFSNVGSWFSTTFSTAWSNVKSAWSETKSFFSTKCEEIKGAFSNIGSWFSDTFSKACEGAKKAWSSAQPFFTKVWDGIKGVYSNVDSYMTNSCFAPAWNGVKGIWNAATGYFKTVWESIKGIFSVVKSVLTGNWRDAWNGIKGIVGTWKSYFANVWSQIKGVFGNVKSWFSSTFSAAWAAVKNVFSGWSSFFGGLWTQIKNKFSAIGTNIANAISGAVRSGINGVISAIEGVINKGIGLINGAISLINKIPGVNIGKLGNLSLPRLAKGGVLYGETAFIGGEYPGARNNPEIVTPQNVMRETFEDTLNAHLESNLNFDRFAAAIKALASRPINIGVDGVQFATATAGATDSVSGNRLNLRNRGLAL